MGHQDYSGQDEQKIEESKSELDEQSDGSNQDDDSDTSDPIGQGDRADLNSRLITDIRVAVLHQDPVPHPDAAEIQNHWSIFLIFSEDHGGGSARINMRTKVEGATAGTLEFKAEQSYTEARREIQHWSFPVIRDDITYLQLTNRVLRNGRGYYEMPGGSGCRYWVWQVMQDFVEDEPKHKPLAQPAYIDKDAVKTLWSIMENQYPKSGEPIHYEMVRGTFTQTRG